MDIQSLWAKACSFMRSEMTDVTYNTWIASALKPLDYSGDRCLIEAVTDYYHQFVISRYTALISGAVNKAAGREIQLEIFSPKQAEDFRKGLILSTPKATPKLNPKYTFKTFVVGSGNRFAHAASLAVAEEPADAYNPLFLYGGVGLGKTHLMHAIGHFILSKKSDARLEYVTSEEFTTELITAIQTKRNVAFREKYRNVDVLLIDDIQFIAGRDSTQEEFFHTFNTLHNAGKQIIISSDRPPKEIAKLEERLRSRFEWGLIADVQKPDFDTRMAILREKAQDTNLLIGDDVLEIIAQKVDSNIRELEGTLIRLSAYASLMHTNDISVAVAQEALKEVFVKTERRPVSCEDIVEAVAEYFSVSAEELMGPRRSRAISVPRQIVMHLARELTDASLPKIGQVLGGRDHTTVIHGCAKIEELYVSTRSVKTAVDDLKKRLGGS